ncbi:sugar-binding domain-containing protein [Pontibacter sp. G13]|uniref:sugar-binding domain-containing protein n=1 Tax=Pontibacter sp. G13 TaxID=3074898 RepID=UPI00288AB3BD|nr:sugar-binding domain-containing protein [Pontibacter sp. G13]WNJ20081.1 glycoside hydrolase family 2 TIM barrel-domain containing protein [Pontibacter sp. G13]
MQGILGTLPDKEFTRMQLHTRILGRVPFGLVAGLLLAMCPWTTSLQAQSPSFLDGWKFAQGDHPEAIQPQFEDSDWETVSIPHDWSIAGPFDRENPSFSRGAWLPAGICFYRKTFDLPIDVSHKLVSIYFDGAYRNAEVWINGHYLGKRPMGYIAFEYDLTPYLRPDNEQVLTVKLDNSAQPGSRWYSGTGIYREAYLKFRDPIHIPTWGAYTRTESASTDKATLFCEVPVLNSTNADAEVEIRTAVISETGSTVAQTRQVIGVGANQSGKVSFNLDVKNPALWSLDHPHRYRMNHTLVVNGAIRHTESYWTGIREMTYDSDRGFSLNGEWMKLKGVCLHHAGGPLGAAVERATIERQILKLKAMGCNSIRTAHNPFSTEFFEVCDSMGILVMAESFDEWQVVKEPKTFRENGDGIRIPVDYYAELFDEWADRDLTDMILRDRNHPSIFMWSIGNEIEQMREESGIAITARLQNICHSLDNRPVTNGINGYGWGSFPNREAEGVLDVVGYNYAKDANFVEERKNYPNRKVIVTETTSAQTFRARGSYTLDTHFPDRLGLPYEENPDTKKFLDNRGDFQAGIDMWKAVKHRDHVMGHFIWTGWDYLGETIPYPWPARSSSFGVIDLAGFPKDGYYFYQSQWTPEPMVHIFPHWNWKGHEGKTVTVKGFTNAEEVEILVNGRTFGIRLNDPDSAQMLEWKVPYTPGNLTAVARVNGAEVARQEIYTAGKARTVEFTTSTKPLIAGGRDLRYVEVQIVDRNGYPVPDAMHDLTFTVAGAGSLAGVGNGNPQSTQSFVADHHQAFHGKALAIVRSGEESGTLTLTVSAKGLKRQTLTWEVAAPKTAER